MLITNKKLQATAQKKHYGFGAFNIYDMESIQSVVRAAEKVKSPAIIATTEGAISYAGHKFLVDIIKLAAGKSKIPFSMHLDHGKDMEIIKNCIKLGYTSVMIDASSKPFADNIRTTKKVITIAHKKGVSVEAELGTIGGVEDSVSAKQILLTDPQDAKEFVERTGCDMLAIAIGTSHGAYKFTKKSKLDIARLKEIKKVVKIPLVLHGASGIPPWIVKKAKFFGAVLGSPHGVDPADIQAAVKNGISKVNIDSDLRLTFDATIREVLKTKPEVFDPRKILGPARDAMQEMIEYKMKLFGSAGKAR